MAGCGTGSPLGNSDICGVQRRNISHYRREHPGVYRRIDFRSIWQVVPLKHYFTHSHFLQILIINNKYYNAVLLGGDKEYITRISQLSLLAEVKNI